jgi:PKD repeat protein
MRLTALIFLLVVLLIAPVMAIAPNGAWLSSAPDPGHEGNKTIDGSIVTYSVSSTGGSANVNVTFPDWTTITGVEIYNQQHTPTDYVRSYNINPLYDGSNTTYQISNVPINTWGTLALSPPAAYIKNIYIFKNDAVWANYTEFRFYGYNATWNDTAPPVADFVGVPLNGTGPLSVTFTDIPSSGTSVATSWNWSSSPAAYFDNASGQNTHGYFVSNGDYTITHCVASAYGSDCETKNDYIQVYNSTELVATGFKAIDGRTGFGISAAQVDLEDIENASWTNTTTIEGLAVIYTLTGHHINAYASASGYADADLLNQPAVHQKIYSILMFSANESNVSAGNVTLYIHVKDYDTLAPIPGAGVTWINAGGPTMTHTANAAGIASFVVPNNTNIKYTAEKSGYNSKTQTVNSGTGSGGDAYKSDTILLTKSVVTQTPVITTLPGGGLPTTLLPGCEKDPYSPECRAAHANYSLGLLAEYMDDLILLCIMVTILYLLGFKLGG